MNLYVATFENMEYTTDVIWFEAEPGEEREEALLTIQDWEGLDDEDMEQITIGQIYEVTLSDKLIKAQYQAKFGGTA